MIRNCFEGEEWAVRLVRLCDYGEARGEKRATRPSPEVGKKETARASLFRRVGQLSRHGDT